MAEKLDPTQDNVMESRLKAGVRLAFHCNKWKVLKEEWILAAQCIQAEDRQRIGRYIYQRDARTNMASQLLRRKGVADFLGMDYDKIVFARSEQEKPYLENDPKTCVNFNFNVSHQGDYVVMAIEPTHQIGIDVMEIEYRRKDKSASDYIKSMKDQMTGGELKFCLDPENDRAKLKNFYRIWCLKEGYIKAVGEGLRFGLHRLEFRIHSPISVGTYALDTEILVDGRELVGWRAEETMLDENHISTVVMQQNGNFPWPENVPSYKFVTIKDLLDGAKPQCDADESYWTKFAEKPESPAVRK